MTTLEMTGILAGLMRGETGQAIRKYLEDKFYNELNIFMQDPPAVEATYLSGKLKGIDMVRKGLEGMEAKYRIMEQEIEQTKKTGGGE